MPINKICEVCGNEIPLSLKDLFSPKTVLKCEKCKTEYIATKDKKNHTDEG